MIYQSQPSVAHIAAALALAEARLAMDPDLAAWALDGVVRDLVALRYPFPHDLPPADDPFAVRLRLALRAPHAAARLVHCRALLRMLSGAPSGACQASSGVRHRHAHRHSHHPRAASAPR